ncbi:MAG: hypothetical protein AAFR46_02705 [Pseudomonadota bacterium]
MSARATDFEARHARVGRALICALGAGGEARHFEQLVTVLEAHLSRTERMGLLAAAIGAAEVEDAVAVMSAALGDATEEGAGPPVPPLGSLVEEASAWTEMASDAEIAIFCLATFNAMRGSRREDFLAHVRGL